MPRYTLSTADLDLIALLCREVAELAQHKKWKRYLCLEQWTAEDFARAAAIADQLDTPEPRVYELGTPYTPPETYTPPGGRL